MGKDIERKIAVIFVTDVVGFSKLMEQNEDETLRSFRLCRAMLDDLFKEHGGRIFNTAGDSVLAEFTSAVSAVICAKDFQKLIKDRNSNFSENIVMQFRIGINMGDVIVEEENLYGDGVNVAARLEALCQPGGVCLSKSIMDFVNKKVDMEFHDLGDQKVKNTMLHAFDLVDSDLKKRDLKQNQVNADKEVSKPPTIAVLPFANLSNDPEQDYFAEGITEDIISHLSQWKTFPVISSNSVMIFKGSNEPTKRIAEKLGARYLVVGSVRKGGNKVRINAKLINADEDTQIWSQNWDRSLEDIFEIQDEVSQKVAVFVSPALRASELKRLSDKKNVNLSSWDQFLQGLSLFNRSRTAHSLESQFELKRKALSCCEKAIELDANFSEPHIIICACMVEFMFVPQLSSERNENEEKFQKHAEKGYDIDPNNPDAIFFKGFSFYMKQDLGRVRELISKALNINPNHPRSLEMQSIQCQQEGKFDEAIECIKKVMEVDPASRTESESWLVFCYISKNDWSNALISIDRCIEDTPHDRYFGFKAAVLALDNQIEESQVWLAKFQNERPEIKTLTDYKKVVPEMSESLRNNLVEGMKLAGLQD